MSKNFPETFFGVCIIHRRIFEQLFSIPARFSMHSEHALTDYHQVSSSQMPMVPLSLQPAVLSVASSMIWEWHSGS
jgi:hypothetical protein